MRTLLINLKLWLVSLNTPKLNLCAAAGALGGIITYLLGGWTEGMKTLLVLMAIDYTTGWIVAAVFKQSKKTESGGLSSNIGWKGLLKKVTEWMLIVAMHGADMLLGFDYLRDLCIIGFALNELISIAENVGLMGIPLPPVVSKAIDILNVKANADIKEDNANHTPGGHQNE
ncbi:MAG: phage holin family protein [Pseudobutyrivibrio sp.]|nr:phage holin family protein [Pseudobutyrivibrio sp.]